MTLATIVAIAALVATVVIQLLTAVFVYGRTTERVKVQGEQIGRHGQKIEKLEDSESRHEGEIGELFGFAGLRRKR